MFNLHLIRHAESNGNAAGDYSVLDADALSNKGLFQAENLALNLGDQSFKQILVSPFQRAQETIYPYLKKNNIKAEIWPELSEACWQDEKEDKAERWESVPAKIENNMGTSFQFKDGIEIKAKGDASYGEDLLRVHNIGLWIDNIKEEYEGEILIVSHAHFIRELMYYLLSITNCNSIHHDNCGQTLLTYNKGWSLRYSNRVF